MFENINEVSILVTAILAVAVGSVWYSPLLFGEIWMKSIGIQAGDEVMPPKEMKVAVLKGILNQLIFFFAATSLVASMGSSVELWKFVALLVVLLASQGYGPVLWEKKSCSYYFINIGYTSFVLVLGLTVITYWPW